MFLVMDGRANYDVDEALVLVALNSIEECFEVLQDFGPDTCIVVDNEVIFSLSWIDEPHPEDQILEAKQALIKRFRNSSK